MTVMTGDRYDRVTGMTDPINLRNNNDVKKQKIPFVSIFYFITVYFGSKKGL